MFLEQQDLIKAKRHHASHRMLIKANYCIILQSNSFAKITVRHKASHRRWPWWDTFHLCLEIPKSLCNAWCSKRQWWTCLLGL